SLSFLLIPAPTNFPLFPYTTLFRSMISAPFCPAAAGTTCKPSVCRHTSLAGSVGDRRPTSARSDSGAMLAHARRGAISLLATAGARAVRSVGEQSRLSRFRDDSGDQCFIESAGAQAP